MREPTYSPELNAHIWRSFRNPSGQLRCGILLDGCGGMENWARQAVELLGREPRLAIESVYLLPSEPASASPGVLFEWLYRWRSDADLPLSRVEIQVPSGATVLHSDAGKEQTRAKIAAAGLDVLIWLESGALVLDCDGLARLGVWYFCCGDPAQPRSAPPYWREAASGWPVSTLALVQDAGKGKVCRRAVCHLATQQGLPVSRNAVQPLGLAGPLLVRKLLDALDPDTRDSLPLQPIDPRRFPPPGNFEAAGVLARLALRTISLQCRSRRRKTGWFVALRTQRELFRAGQDRFLPQAFREVPSPAGAQLADPFLVEEGGRHWLFVEEIPAGTTKGRLSVLELDAHGAAGPPVPILDKPYHQSYPFVFRHGADFFMLPETSANHTIELYRATRFPFEWKLEKVLLSNVRAVDTTPLLLDGIWYFWTTSARLGQETFLFWSKTLDGEWHYHPRNPICSDVRRARGAGPLFLSRGSLIRPAQDCSLRYGHAIALNRVLRLSPAEYEEELIEVIDPSWRTGLLGTHTLCSNDTFEALDGEQYLG